MKSEAAFSTFHYHACAHAFSGRFNRPFDHLIDVQAATSLPVIGGHGSSRVENFQFRESLGFIEFFKGFFITLIKFLTKLDIIESQLQIF